MEKWKSRKLWFFISSFVAGVGLAVFGQLTAEVVSLLIGLPTVYGVVNVRAKSVEGVELEGGDRGDS